jgi:hypothetical protein
MHRSRAVTVWQALGTTAAALVTRHLHPVA